MVIEKSKYLKKKKNLRGGVITHSCLIFELFFNNEGCVTGKEHYWPVPDKMHTKCTGDITNIMADMVSYMP